MKFFFSKIALFKYIFSAPDLITFFAISKLVIPPPKVIGVDETWDTFFRVSKSGFFLFEI